jgi:diguanylate cyclase (GGDEF)-like protein
VIFPLIMLVLGAAAGLTIASLQDRAASARESQLEISALRITVRDLEYAAFSVTLQAGGTPATALAEILGDEKMIAADLGRLVRSSPPQALKSIPSELSSTYPIVMAIYDIGAHEGGYNGPQAGEATGLQGTMFADVGYIDSQLLVATSDYAHRAASAQNSATAGTLATIAFLLAAFGLFYFRSVRARRSAEHLATENTRLLERSQLEALTDALTGLRNRRSLIQDLEIQLESGRPSRLCFFDLDGFKLYNDTFGHGAGDALLHRFGTKLAAALQGRGRAYRMGGDEFCILVNDRRDDVLPSAQSALSESGDGWSVSPSTGSVFLPEEANIADAALHVADQRMYTDKVSRQGLDQRLSRRWVDTTLADRANQVERLAAATSSTVGIAPAEVETIRAAI